MLLKKKSLEIQKQREEEAEMAQKNV